ncbi:ChaN family lipoprotein [Acidovorax sp. HDW3]|uniref:ChaN family lipoprotein n=1 Tax=Acidovorax sp. HDW3 TaxID=2714923 RepID=UPI00140A50A3|nr:ChaN family lipoprotein [Acidovorax sp. HDW3]QIL42935.1 ChaN family lipoprotein [Acidovorax sp. HDW3]
MKTLRPLWPLAALSLWLAGCASLAPPPLVPELPLADWPAPLASTAPPALLLLGEQHDAAAHQQWQAHSVQWLAARGQLAALVLEMAEAGHSTQGLPAQADAAAVRQALAWNDSAWPWAHYGPAVLAAVRAGVPVYGGNLPRAQMKAAQQDSALDTHLSAPAWQRQQDAVRAGHCDLLPPAQILPMARIQLARDRSLAQTGQALLQPGRTVLLIAGLQHVQRHLGIPTWWGQKYESKVAIAQAGQAQAAIKTEADWIVLTPALAPRDHCAELRQSWGAPPRATPLATPGPGPAAAP